MENDFLLNFSVSREDKAIHVDRVFEAPLQRVWAAWTESQLLDQWWAPKPWRAETQKMNFNPDGSWLYVMIGPDGEKHWARTDFQSIVHLKSFSSRDAFSDENGVINNELPQSLWTVRFSEYGESTLVSINIEYDSLSDLEASLEMGFQEGFTDGMRNLDEFLEF